MEELIIRSLQGRVTLEEQERLQRWRERSPTNEHQYQQIAKLWALTGRVGPSAHRPEPPDVALLLERVPEVDGWGADPSEGSVMGRRPSSTSKPAPSRRSPRLLGEVLKAAAVAAVLVSGGYALGQVLGGPERPESILAGGEIVTGPQEMVTLTLGDGSSVRLGPQSELRLSQDGKERVVWLNGRAFFGVEADAERTFSVRTPYGEAAALGTRFEVRSEDDAFRVLVVEGSVRVSAGEAEAELSEGHMGESSRGHRLSTRIVEDTFAQLDWMGTVLVFQATPFGRAMQEVERRYGVDVVVEDPALAEITVTATFTDQDLEQVLLVLCEVVAADCALEGDVVEVRGGAASSPGIGWDGPRHTKEEHQRE